MTLITPASYDDSEDEMKAIYKACWKVPQEHVRALIHLPDVSQLLIQFPRIRVENHPISAEKAFVKAFSKDKEWRLSYHWEPQHGTEKSHACHIVTVLRTSASPQVEADRD